LSGIEAAECVSGCTGIPETLTQAGIVESTGEWVRSGFVQVPKGRLRGRGI
jgi:hypothetical protein